MPDKNANKKKEQEEIQQYNEHLLNVDTKDEDTEESEERHKEPSPFYKFFSTVFYTILLCSLFITVVIMLFSLDFLDILTFRNSIPENMRKMWPLDQYYEFVKLHQLPDEERYQQMLYIEQNKYNKLMSEGNKNLEERAKALEDSYRALIRTQKEQNKLEQEALRKKQEELALQQKKLEDGLADLEKRKAAVDDLSNRLASEALNIESSLIRFMEKENRLDQICAIAANMEPKALAKVFDEVPDDQLIYDIMGGLQPGHSAKTLANMDPEKAAKIIKISNIPLRLPEPGPSRSYIPQSLTNLIDETQRNRR